MKRWFVHAVSITAILFFAASAVHAAVLPPFTISISDGSNSASWDSDGVDNGDGTFTYGGEQTETDWDINWNYLHNPDPSVDGFIAVKNPLAVAKTYIITVSAPISPAISPTSLVGGSISGSLTDSGGATGAILSTNGTNPIFTPIIDGVDYLAGTLIGGFQQFTVAAKNGSITIPAADFGMPIPSQVGPPALTSIGLRLEFVLSPGDVASFTSVFVVEPVPEPSTIFLAVSGLGLVGFSLVRRGRK